MFIVCDGGWKYLSTGAYTDDLGRVSGTFVYRVCEEGTNICSNTASVTF